MKIAFLLSRFPYPLDKGDKVRAFNQIRDLSKEHKIILFAIHDSNLTNEDLEKLRPYCKKIHLFKPRWYHKIRGLWWAFRNKLPFQTGIVYSPAFHQKIKSEINQEGVDVIFCQLIRMAAYCEDINKKKIIDFMDAFSVSMLKRADLSNFFLSFLYKIESSRVAKYERWCYTKFEESTVISEGDQMWIGSRTKVISNGIDTEVFKPNATIEKKYDIGIVGNFGYPPNIEAGKNILQKILTGYEKKFGKKLKLLIAGVDANKVFGQNQNENIHVKGRYEDISEAYNSFKVLCGAITSRTGQQNKVLESMACGTPVVCFEEVNQSINAERDKEIMLGKTTDDLIDKIHLILNDDKLYQQISENAKSFVEKHYSWEKWNEELSSIIKRIGAI